VSERIQDLLARVSATEGSAKPGDAELRERFPCTGNLAALEREIASEIAYSLGRAGSKLEAAVQQAQRTLLLLESAALEADERRALVARFNEERALAERRLRDLVIQREALGFRRHSDLSKFYPIPARLPER